MLGDKAYDSAELREQLNKRGTQPVIPNRCNRKQPFSFSKRLYKLRWRYLGAMKSGIHRPDEGYDIIINGVDRSFRDRKEVAYEAARYCKQRHPKELVEIRIRATGARIVMLEDGRTG